MPPALQTHALSKNYGAVRAVDGLSLCVDPGEIYAFLGLNGAGKTTTIRMLLGMIRPTTGHAEVLGKEIRPGQGPWADVGYLSEEPRAYPGLTVRENLEIFRRLRPGLAPAAIGRAIDRFGLVPFADRRASALSHGNRQRLG
ncbi:MAG: ABC transporter ATP-binding protein, partial [Anaerolineales bacterium]